MSDRPKGARERVLEEGIRLLSRAAEQVMKDPRGQELVARAVGAAQRGKERLERTQERVLHALGLPAREDYREVAKHMARLKRKLRELEREMAGEGRPGSGRAEGEGQR
jgi:hypothetical protein